MENVDLSELQKERLDFDQDVQLVLHTICQIFLDPLRSHVLM